VARFVDVKGHRYIVEAIERVAAAGRAGRVGHVGREPLRGEIERLAKIRLPKVTVLRTRRERSATCASAWCMCRQHHVGKRLRRAFAWSTEAQAVGRLLSPLTPESSEALLHAPPASDVERNAVQWRMPSASC